jgi:hypothetical protein
MPAFVKKKIENRKIAVAGQLGRVIVLGYLLPDHGNLCDAFCGLVHVIFLTHVVARVTGRKTCSKDIMWVWVCVYLYRYTHTHTHTHTLYDPCGSSGHDPQDL